MVKPKVTIGVCVRNCADSISEVLNSIIKQDFSQELMELIIVDDGSEDQTLAIINKQLPKIGMRANVVHHAWKGLGPSRNVVVNNASGDYILWVDGDMTLPIDHVRKQVEFMDKHITVGIGKGMYKMYHAPSLAAYLENVDAIVEFVDLKKKSTSKPLGTGGAVYRVKAIRDIDGFDENFKGAGEDIDAESRIRKAGWLLKITPATFYEIRRTSWRALWNEYLWHGLGMNEVFRKKELQESILRKMFPPSALIIQVSRSCFAYKLFHNKSVFLLPFHWFFKRSAWCVGLAKRRP